MHVEGQTQKREVAARGGPHFRRILSIPAVNTNASIPFKAASMEPDAGPQPVHEHSKASPARALPPCMAATISRMSPEMPEMPDMPDFVFRVSSRALPSVRLSRNKNVRMPGSTDPDRVPIINPSSGVNPIVVSMLLPPDRRKRAAVAEVTRRRVLARRHPCRAFAPLAPRSIDG